MFIPAMHFLRLLGPYVGPVAWIAFAGVIAWFLAAIRRARRTVRINQAWP